MRSYCDCCYNTCDMRSYGDTVAVHTHCLFKYLFHCCIYFYIFWSVCVPRVRIKIIIIIIHVIWGFTVTLLLRNNATIAGKIAEWLWFRWVLSKMQSAPLSLVILFISFGCPFSISLTFWFISHIQGFFFAVFFQCC